MNIGENLQRARKRKNLSQEEAAIKLNVTRQCVSLWENGQTAPTLDNLESLSNLYGLSISVLMGQVAFPEDREDRNAAIERRKEEERLRKEQSEIEDASRKGVVGMILGICATLFYIIPVVGIVITIIGFITSLLCYRKLKDFRSIVFIIINIVYLVASFIFTFSRTIFNMF